MMDEQRLSTLKPGEVAVVGLPLDENSSYLRGAAQAPQRIRELLHCDSSNLSTEAGGDLSSSSAWHDVGDLELPQGAQALTRIEQGITALLARRVHVLSLGGDHSVTWPVVAAYARSYADLSILHLDAHPDLYDEYDGSRSSHACPFARIMEAGLATRLVQVGIRTMVPHQRRQAERFGVEVVEMRQWQPEMRFRFNGPVYISLDMDVLDPAFAPGVSHHEPGGLSTRQVLGILENVEGQVVGADIVEFNPTRDPLGITGMAAVKFTKELVARMGGI
jgi:agmatinase